MRLDIAAQSDTGRRKKNNEDAYGVYQEDTPGLTFFQEGALLCVADGLGGHMGGEIASKLAVSIIKDVVKESAHPVPAPEEAASQEGPFPALRAAMQRANASVFQTNQDLVKKGKPMGTTVLAALVEPKKVYIVNVGDSRAYHLREGEIIDRTEDHSWVDEQVKLGLMSKAEAETDTRRNIVTRCVGTHPEISADTYHWNIIPGDQLLLCTDGLVNMVHDSEIVAIFRRGGTAAEISHSLVDLANENGGKDNITVIVVTVSPNPVRQVVLKTRGLFRRAHFTWGWFFFLLVYGLACLGAGGYFLGRHFPR